MYIFQQPANILKLFINVTYIKVLKSNINL
jgi:hypothetical protein